jgi:hypothetical protein
MSPSRSSSRTIGSDVSGRVVARRLMTVVTVLVVLAFVLGTILEPLLLAQ